MLPPAIGIEVASPTQAPLATVVIGGLFAPTILSLIVVPMLPSRNRKSRRRAISNAPPRSRNNRRPACSQRTRFVSELGPLSRPEGGSPEFFIRSRQAAGAERVESDDVVSYRGRLAIISIAAFLSGCSGVGWLPGGGVHAMNPARLDTLVRTYSRVNSVPAALVRAVIDTESHGDPSAVSRAGAQGLMQLMPGTQALYGVANPFDPAANVSGGTRYLHDLLMRYHNDVQLALAAYNAGPAAVEIYHGIPPFAETRSYVARVSAELRSL